jgi:hypothetical protein
VKLVFPSNAQTVGHEDRFGSGVSRRDPGPRGRGRRRRRSGRESIGAYHEQQLWELLERVREGFARLDAQRDRCVRARRADPALCAVRQELWKFCGSSSRERERATRNLAALRGQRKEPDWWHAGERLAARWRTPRLGALTLAGGPSESPFARAFDGVRVSTEHCPSREMRALSNECLTPCPAIVARQARPRSRARLRRRFVLYETQFGAV